MSENQNIEWKTSWRDEYLKWICGFANAQGGKIYIGKDDAGSIVGLKNAKKLMDDLPNKIRNYLGIVCEVNLHESRGKQFLEIIIQPYSVAISMHGRYYYRSGSVKTELAGNALTEFLLKKSGKTWDDVVENSAHFNDIDLDAVKIFKKAANKSMRLPKIENESKEFIFENLRLTEGKYLKRAALLLFGKDIRNFFPSAFAKIGRFGASDTDLLSQEVIESNAFELADQILEILDKKYFKKTISYEGLQRIEKPEYPYEAIREILLNAIVHRQYLSNAPIQISIYDDKFMVWNDGVLPNNLTIEDLKRKHPSYPRNPLLAEIFFKGGLIEAWGRGTLKVIKECKDHGLPEPEIEIVSGGINVTVLKDRYNEKYLKEFGLNDRQIKAVLYTKENGQITNAEFQKILNVSKRTATNDLDDLLQKGLFEKTGTRGRGTFYKIKA